MVRKVFMCFEVSFIWFWWMWFSSDFRMCVILVILVRLKVDELFLIEWVV